LRSCTIGSRENLEESWTLTGILESWTPTNPNATLGWTSWGFQDGYRLSVVFLKLFEKLHATLTAGLLDPLSGDANLPDDRISNLDKLYLGVSTALDNLIGAVGLQAAQEQPLRFWLLASQANKIHVTDRITV
jgi:hypothetical protein